MFQNLVDDGFLFVPIALEVVFNVKDENRKVVQVVTVQPKTQAFLYCPFSLFDLNCNSRQTDESTQHSSILFRKFNLIIITRLNTVLTIG